MKSLATPLAVVLALGALASTAAARSTDPAPEVARHIAAVRSVAPTSPTPPALRAIRFAHVADRMPAPAFSCPWRPLPWQGAAAPANRHVAAASVAGGGVLVALLAAGIVGRHVRRARRAL